MTALGTASTMIRTYGEDYHDPRLAGLGLAYAPMIEELVGIPQSGSWEMSPAEQAAMYYLLSTRKPRVGIEIGTKFGGSLAAFAAFCGHVYTLDIDETTPERLAGRHQNVTFVIGDSRKTLPDLIKSLETRGEQIGFVLIDGDHSPEGVAADIRTALTITPRAPVYVVLHDSFNPECRQGMRAADWGASPYVHAVEMDFVPGVVNPSPQYKGQMWGGLALAIMLPDPRNGPLKVTSRGDLSLERLTRPRTLGTRIENKVRRLLGMNLVD